MSVASAFTNLSPWGTVDYFDVVGFDSFRGTFGIVNNSLTDDAIARLGPGVVYAAAFIPDAPSWAVLITVFDSDGPSGVIADVALAVRTFSGECSLSNTVDTFTLAAIVPQRGLTYRLCCSR